MRQWVVWGTLVAALVAGAPSSASGAEPPESPDAAARRHYEAGRKAFDLGEFDKAIVAYKEAYKLKPDPAFLFNIAQSCRLSNDPAQAAFFYRSYLRNRPDAPNRDEVEERIKQMDEAARKTGGAGPTPNAQPAGPPSPPPVSPPPSGGGSDPPRTDGPSLAPPPPADQSPIATVATTGPVSQEPRPFYMKPWVWGVAGAVVVGVVVGIVVASGGGGAPKTKLGTTPVF